MLISIPETFYKIVDDTKRLYYNIRVQYYSWDNKVHRRYSEFFKLHQLLETARNLYPEFKLPKFPTWVRLEAGYTNILEDDLIEDRKEALLIYLNELKTNEIALASSYFGDFLGFDEEVRTQWINENRGFVSFDKKAHEIPLKFYAKTTLSPSKFPLSLRNGIQTQINKDSILNMNINMNKNTSEFPQPMTYDKIEESQNENTISKNVIQNPKPDISRASGIIKEDGKVLPKQKYFGFVNSSKMPEIVAEKQSLKLKLNVKKSTFEAQENKTYNLISHGFEFSNEANNNVSFPNKVIPSQLKATKISENVNDHLISENSFKVDNSINENFQISYKTNKEKLDTPQEEIKIEIRNSTDTLQNRKKCYAFS